ncbi:YigZ family protein [Xinfangfangia sp. CPCC 101601]|uniref:YigZ family protein n=1 Tax=Pseudogemmobacter lacusdianii TaxID=3069608 RepID=A0ABU0VTF4_9RHOB|nr:YigZ family protein [Xinfangfangia sp. CPCC 101601]MDQ2064813.1 YigZ family protein [Xinfangfangia sp. CPCC 101601]
MIRIDDVLRDRGSRYAVSGGPVEGRAGAEAFIKALKREKKFAKATHNSWALLCQSEGPIKNDDGESGAGAVILKMLEREGLRDYVIVVTRWYGGVHLGGDRFAHVVTCVRALLDAKRAGG